MAKTNFIFQRGWKKLIDRLPEIARLEVYEGLIDYVNNDVDPASLPISSEARVCLNTIIEQLDDPKAFERFAVDLSLEPTVVLVGKDIDARVHKLIGEPALPQKSPGVHVDQTAGEPAAYDPDYDLEEPGVTYAMLFLTEWADKLSDCPDELRLRVYDTVTTNLLGNGVFDLDLLPEELHEKVLPLVNDFLNQDTRLSELTKHLANLHLKPIFYFDVCKDENGKTGMKVWQDVAETEPWHAGTKVTTSFVFLRKWLDKLGKFSPVERLALYDAIIAHVAHEAEPIDLSQKALACYRAMVADIEKDDVVLQSMPSLLPEGFGFSAGDESATIHELAEEILFLYNQPEDEADNEEEKGELLN